MRHFETLERERQGLSNVEKVMQLLESMDNDNSCIQTQIDNIGFGPGYPGARAN